GARPVDGHLRRAASSRQSYRPLPEDERSGGSGDDVSQRTHPSGGSTGRSEARHQVPIGGGRESDVGPPHRSGAPGPTRRRQDPPSRDPRTLHRAAHPEAVARRRLRPGGHRRAAPAPLDGARTTRPTGSSRNDGATSSATATSADSRRRPSTEAVSAPS